MPAAGWIASQGQIREGEFAPLKAEEKLLIENLVLGRISVLVGRNAATLNSQSANMQTLSRSA